MWQACKKACKLGPVYSYLPLIQRNDKTTTNDLKEKVEIFEETFFSAQPNADFTDIQDFIYPTGINMPAITDKEIKNAIFRPVLD